MKKNNYKNTFHHLSNVGELRKYTSHDTVAMIIIFNYYILALETLGEC